MQHLAELEGALRGAQLAALGGLLPRLRVRLLGHAPQRARDLGGAVRRLRQRRAGDHRPVHRLGPLQVGRDLAPHAVPPARLRGQRPGALLGAARALPAARRRRQPAHRQRDDPGAALPPAAPPGRRPHAPAARRDDAQGPAAAQGVALGARRLHGRHLPADHRRPRQRRLARGHQPPRALLRPPLLRPAAPRRARGGRRGRDRAHRAALSVPDGRADRAAGGLHEPDRDRLGPGRAGQHGRLALGAPPRRGRRPAGRAPELRRPPLARQPVRGLHLGALPRAGPHRAGRARARSCRRRSALRPRRRARRSAPPSARPRRRTASPSGPGRARAARAPGSPPRWAAARRCS